MFTHAMRTIFAGGGESAVEKLVSRTGNAEINQILSVEDSTEPEFAVAIDVSTLKSFFAVSDKDVTIRANDDSGGSPTGTITLKANVPYLWVSDGGVTNPFGVTDVTSLFIQNASVVEADDATVRISILTQS